MSATAAGADDALFRKVGWRILPILLAAYVIGYVDRVGISIAKLDMARDLSFSDAVYGFGSGIFFVGYVIFEVPSNLMLHRVGARPWIARIMISWGIVAMAMMFVNSPASFYALRFLLGAAEAGFLPGAIYYLTHWYPPERRARVFGILITGAAIGGLIVGPISGWIMARFEGVAGLHNWQWLFLIEGAPAVLLGLLVLALLTERPDRAAWLSAEEKRQLQSLNAPVDGAVSTASERGIPPFLLCALGLVMLAVNVGIYLGVFWLPTMLKATGVDDIEVIGLLSALPYGGSIVAMLGLGASSDRRGERRIHASATIALGAIATIGAAMLAGTPTLSCALTIAATALFIGVTPLMWTVLSQLVSGRAAAVAFAILNIFAAIGGFLGPYIMGLSNSMSGGNAAALYTAGAMAIVGAVIVFIVAPREGRKAQP